MRKTCLNMVCELARQDPRIVFIGSDLGKDTLKEFKEEMPERFFMEGVGEANVVGMAAGFALEGKIPYVNTIATFLTRRCFDQIVVDLCLHNANVRLIGNGGGLVYAPLGVTHEAIEDLAILRALPNMTIVVPADANEMRRLMPKTVDHSGPIYIRLAKGHDPIVTSDAFDFEIGRAFSYREGSDALILSTGVTLKIALEAAEMLERCGRDVSILHCPTIKPFDKQSVLDCVARVPVVVSVEEHTICGGLGSATAEAIAEADFHETKRFRRIGIPDLFPDDYGSQASLMQRYRITAENVCSVVEELCQKHTPTTIERQHEKRDVVEIAI